MSPSFGRRSCSLCEGTSNETADEKQSVEQATDILQDFAQWHQDAWLDGFNRKLGFASSAENDKERAEALLDLLQQGGIDFTLFFRRLSDLADKEADRSALLALLDYPEVRKTSLLQQNLNDWLDNWQQDLAHRESDLHAAQQRMKAASPALIPRNHNVQAAIRAAEEGDFSVFENLNFSKDQSHKTRTPHLAKKGGYSKPSPPSARLISNI